MRRGLTVGQPSKIDTLKTKKIFLLKHKHLAKADFKNTFSVSGQRCGQTYFFGVGGFGPIDGLTVDVHSTCLGRRREKTAI